MDAKASVRNTPWPHVNDVPCGKFRSLDICAQSCAIRASLWALRGGVAVFPGCHAVGGPEDAAEVCWVGEAPSGGDVTY